MPPEKNTGFTFEYLFSQFENTLAAGYEVITCREYAERKKSGKEFGKTLVNRIDIDFSLPKTGKILDIFGKLGIKGTFFLRLHAPEYNPFSFENYRIIKSLCEAGHELGYHSEVIDQSVIWNEKPEDCLRRDIDTMERVFGVKIYGAASHRGLTGYNNLDFWKERHPSEFGLLYEAYDNNPEFGLFHSSYFISDSDWTYWKCYDRGNPVKDCRKSLSEHSREGHKLLYTLIHPDTYFENHFYE